MMTTAGATRKIIKFIVLVGVNDPAVFAHLTAGLDLEYFELKNVALEGSVMETALADVPDIVILELKKGDEKPGLDVVVLKKICPNTRIIALSPEPSIRDGSVLEKGIFYYLSGPWREHLVQVIEAAGRSLRSRKTGPSRLT